MPFENYRKTTNPAIMTALYYEDPQGPFWFYKYCNNIDAESKKLYEDIFRQEYDHMNNLYKLMCRKGKERIYRKLFPVYHSASHSKNTGRPYIAMEYIEGPTLEEFLSSCGPKGVRPARILSNKQLKHLFDQLHEAIYWLHEVGIMHIDLHPQNIIVLNDDFDIKLIDFTNCYFQNGKIKVLHAIDRHINPNLPPALQLREACVSLFTRLFYCGHEHYIDYCDYKLFPRDFEQLLNCQLPKLEPTNSSLAYFEEWYSVLCKIFS